MFDFYLVLPHMHLFGNDVIIILYIDCHSEETYYVSLQPLHL